MGIDFSSQERGTKTGIQTTLISCSIFTLESRGGPIERSLFRPITKARGGRLGRAAGTALGPERRLAFAGKAALGGGSAGNDQLAVAGSATGCGATGAGLEYVGVEGPGQARRLRTAVELPETGVREDDWLAGPAGISDRGAASPAG